MRLSFVVVLLVAVVSQVTAQPESTGHLGVVIPSQRVDISAEVAGKVRSMAVALGDSVVAGQVLVEIEVPGLDRQIAQAEASVQGASSRASQTAIELEDLERQLERRARTDDLFTAEELEALEIRRRIKQSELDQADANTQGRQAELALLRERRAALRIRAPYDGVVALCHGSEGSYVQAGESLLRLIGHEPPIIRFAVPAAESSWLVPGARVVVRIEAAEDAELSLPAMVERVSPEVDPAAEMFFAEASFEPRATGGAALSIATGSVVRVRHDPSGGS